MGILGTQIDYQLHPNCSSRFNQKMFGRISWRNNNGNIYTYYIPGVLDNIPHARIFEGRIFVTDMDKIDFDPIFKYCKKFDTEPAVKDEKEIFLQTGRQKWKVHAKEKGYNVVWTE